ncbi:hypothetical protein [Streptomyces europaeiscabiei]|uniref:hypothetical protein n=1 Tax=Streptomyces europaeiscabiei TaxID=146819 RepID=UPI0029C001E7|nr:hypothetical protein [Streptomyces europaeiscabiei]
MTVSGQGNPHSTRSFEERWACWCPVPAGAEPLPTPPHRSARASRWHLARPSPGPPAPRSPYGLDQGPFDGAASPLVRPYLVAVEREQARQSRRRLALVLAADFGVDLDLDRHTIGAEQVVAC